MADWSWGDAGGFPGGWLGAGSTGLGAFGDIAGLIANLQRQAQARKLFEIQSDPRKLAAYITALFKPMGGAESDAVKRDLGSSWATMTGGAPGGAMNQFVADALAKIESQRYNTAAGTALSGLSGAAGQIPGQLPLGGLSSVLRSLMILKQIGGQKGQSPGLVSMAGPDPYGPEAQQGGYQPSLELPDLGAV